MSDTDIHYEPHIGESRQYWRDIILGLNDGLVSIFLLVAGVVGGGLATRQVLLTAVAGSVAGAVSMAAGEYLATKSQDEVLEAELSLERLHIQEFRQMELDQLTAMFQGMGLRPEDVGPVVEAFDRSEDGLFNAMKALEFGVVDTERRSPYKAMLYSGLLFIVGSAPSVIPFLVVSDSATGLLWSGLLAAIALFAVGATKGRVARTNVLWSGVENLLIAGVGGLVAYGIGAAVGTGTPGA
jgi:VIT1/CCC1 family predicted Fe2+/Mn2+ transporter